MRLATLWLIGAKSFGYVVMQCYGEPPPWLWPFGHAYVRQLFRPIPVQYSLDETFRLFEMMDRQLDESVCRYHLIGMVCLDLNRKKKKQKLVNFSEAQSRKLPSISPQVIKGLSVTPGQGDGVFTKLNPRTLGSSLFSNLFPSTPILPLRIFA